MSTAGSIGKGGTTGVFLRKATGLVREVSLIDALIMNTLGMNVAVGAVFLFLQAPANFPNGNMLLAVVIGTVLMAFTLLWVYSEFARRCRAPAATTCSSAAPCILSLVGCCPGARGCG